MDRPDLDKAKRPVEEIKKATEDMTDEEKEMARRGTTGDNKAEMRPTGSGGSAPPQP